MSLSRITTFKLTATLAGALGMLMAGNAQAQCGGAAVAATMISPANSSTLAGASVMFTWNAGNCVTQYSLSVGSSVGGVDIYSSSQGGNLTATVNNIPTDGRIIYVRLTSSIVGNAVANDYAYLAANGAGGGGGGGGGCGTPAAAAITNPAPGSTLAAATTTFQWSAGACVTQYTLSIGNSVGGTDIYSASQGSNQSVTLGSLPTDGRTLFVRLTSTINGSPQSNDYTFVAFTGAAACVNSTLAAMTSPANGSTLTGASVTFNWSASCNGISYFLYVGNTLGGSDLYFLSQGLQLTTTVNNLPTDGRTLYVRLWTLFQGATDINNGWQFNDYTYHAFQGVVNCVSPSPAAITSPGNGSTLSGSAVAFQWTTGNCVTNYTLSMGSTAGATDIYTANQGTNVATTIPNIPTDGRALFVTLTSTIAGSPQSNSYTYTAFTGSAGGCGTTALATMQSPVNGSTLNGASATFSWNPGCNVSQYFLYVGNGPGGFDIYFQSQGLGLTTTVGSLPTDGRTLYVRLWSLFTGAPGFADGWQYNDYTYQTSASGGSCANPVAGAITSPVNLSTLGGSSVTFQWTAGACVTGFTLSVGNSAGASDIYTAGQGINTSATVPNIPTDGRTIFVRLTSTINGNPQNADYTYTAFQPVAGCGASSLATLTSPANGSTLTGSSATFSWMTGCNATQYFLYIGNQPGLFDILFQNQGTGTSTTVNGLPTDGRVLYVRLWTFFTGVTDITNGWLFNDYVIHASN